jgi:hypothetical protein
MEPMLSPTVFAKLPDMKDPLTVTAHLTTAPALEKVTVLLTASHLPPLIEKCLADPAAAKAMSTVAVAHMTNTARLNVRM